MSDDTSGFDENFDEFGDLDGAIQNGEPVDPGFSFNPEDLPPADNSDVEAPAPTEDDVMPIGERISMGEGSGYATRNADGSITYEDPDGSVYTKNPSGTYTTEWAGQKYTYDPAQEGFVDDKGVLIKGGVNTPVTGGGAKGLLDKVKDSISKNPFAALTTAAAAAKIMSGTNSAQSRGYQGSIPKLEGIRQVIQYNDENRRPGERGRQYFTDMQYVTKGDEAAKAEALQKSAAQAHGIASLQPQSQPKANPWAGKMNLSALTPGGAKKEAASTPASAKPQAPGDKNAETIPNWSEKERMMGEVNPSVRPYIDSSKGTPKDVAMPYVDSSEDTPKDVAMPYFLSEPETDKYGNVISTPSYKSETMKPAVEMDPEYLRLREAAQNARGDSLTMDIKPEERALNRYMKDNGFGVGRGLDALKSVAENAAQANAGSSAAIAPAYAATPVQPAVNPKSLTAVGAGYKPTEQDVSHWEAQERAAQQQSAPSNQGVPAMAHGGIAYLAKGGRYLSGRTDGMADKINTSIDGTQPAKLSHGEFVIPADVVSHLGNGNSEAGADKLYQMMARIRQARTGNPKQGKRINPDKFMPGGIVGLAGGGEVKGFDGTTGSTVTNTGTSAGGVPLDRSTTSSLSPWAGEYVTNALGQGAALAAQPYQAYTGPLTAGASNLQQQAFAGASDLAATGYTPTTFSAGTFDAAAANKYMNPYLSAALNPSLDEARRQAQISRLEDAGRLTKAGAYGGGRQAIMESELNRNLMEKQNKMLGEGYANAYDKAVAQFNAEQNRGLDVQKADEASRQYGADFGIKSLNQLAAMGETERGIEQAGITADKQQFEEQRDWAYKMPQYQLDLLKNLPIKTETSGVDQDTLSKLQSDIAGLASLYGTLSKLGVTPG